MKYKEKPPTIEAFQWTGGEDQTEDPEWVVEAIKRGQIRFKNEGMPGVFMVIDTYAGELNVLPGDYIVNYGRSIFPLPKSDFEAKYEILSETQNFDLDNFRHELSDYIKTIFGG
ncbi:MAG: hypothetical protein H0X33_13110 [Taibaiella sp.]|nr:hypothetical protein [Taibaiella sp.]